MTNLTEASIEIIRAGQSSSGGYAACASFSQYGYSWLRDGTWIAYAMAAAGQSDSAEAFHRWAARTLISHEGKVERLLAKLERGEPLDEADYLPTRFTLDGAIGSDDWTEFQLDGYGTWLWGAVQFCADKPELWATLRPAIALTVRYLAALWPSPNYDCWEEHRTQIHTATLAAIYGGLTAVRSVDPALVPDGLPEQVQAFIFEKCVAPEGHFVKFIGNPEVDASLLWVALPYRVVEINDPRFKATLAKIERDIHRPGGGVYRFRADTYFGGGEWLLLTAWLGWVYAELGRIDEARALKAWVEAQALPDGQMPEQVDTHALDRRHIAPWIAKWGTSACPLLWSHAMWLILDLRLKTAPGHSGNYGKLRTETMPAIVHTPLGQEHPYERLPEERHPRMPLAGEAFTVGIVTRPPGAVQRVTVHSEIDGIAQPPAEAKRLAEWRPEWEEGVGAEFLERKIVIDQDVWQAGLTAPAYGKTLSYWVESDAGATGNYTVRGEAWIKNREADKGLRVEGQGLKPAAIEWLHDGQRVRRVRLTFEARPDEGFFGLGERFNALDQRGNVMDIRVYEQYKSQGKRTYMPIPFLLSSAGYGLWVESARWMQFDVCASSADKWTLEADLGPDETLTLRWFGGKDAFDIIGQFSRATGATGAMPSPLPPEWAFGLWMSANDWNSQARVEKEVAASFDHGIQPTVMVIEAWSDENTFYIWNDAEYAPKPGAEKFSLADFTFPAGGRWPDPKGMTDKLHDQGIRLILWQIPAVKVPEAAHPQHEADRAYYEEAGFGVHNTDGTRHKIRPFWFRGGYVWDVTNPAEREWWLGKREYLLTEMGVDGFKTDGGEHLWGTDTRFADGRGGDELWNVYPQLYTDAYYQFTNKHRQGVTFSRAGYTGSQRSPLHWAGDENSTWDAFRHSIYAGLSAAICGVTFWGWDFGGFSGDVATAELYLRGAAMAAFCPVMQYHAEFNGRREPNRDRTPWNIQARSGDARVLPAFKKLLHARYALMPYIWQEARHSAETGEPMLRAARLIDPKASAFDYLFGRDLFVSPVVAEGATTWDVTLPAGTWRDLWTGAQVEGGRTIRVDVPLDTIPVYVRGGAAIPVRLPDGATLGDPVPFGVEATGKIEG